MKIRCLFFVFQMILWDWDLKHWYKPQYQVSSCADVKLTCRLHLGNPPTPPSWESKLRSLISATQALQTTWHTLTSELLPRFYLTQTFFVLFELR